MTEILDWLLVILVLFGVPIAIAYLAMNGIDRLVKKCSKLPWRVFQNSYFTKSLGILLIISGIGACIIAATDILILHYYIDGMEFVALFYGYIAISRGFYLCKKKSLMMFFLRTKKNCVLGSVIYATLAITVILYIYNYHLHLDSVNQKTDYALVIWPVIFVLAFGRRSYQLVSLSSYPDDFFSFHPTIVAKSAYSAQVLKYENEYQDEYEIVLTEQLYNLISKAMTDVTKNIFIQDNCDAISHCYLNFDLTLRSETNEPYWITRVFLNNHALNKNTVSSAEMESFSGYYAEIDYQGSLRQLINDLPMLAARIHYLDIGYKGATTYIDWVNFKESDANPKFKLLFLLK